MGNKYYVSFSPSKNDYILICIGGEKEKQYIQDIINAKQSDEIIMEITQKKYEELYDIEWV